MSDNEQDFIEGEPEESEGLGPAGRKALEAEREARKAAEKRLKEIEKQFVSTEGALRTERFQRYQAQHPWLQEADLEDVPFDRWDAKVQRWAEIAGATQQATEGSESSEEPKRTDDEVAQAARQFTQASSPGAASNTISFDEVNAKLSSGDLSWAEVRGLIADGRVEGVAPPT